MADGGARGRDGERSASGEASLSLNEVRQCTARRSLGLFPRHFSLRKAALWLVEQPAFDNVVVAFILANSVFLAFDSNEPGFDQTALGRAVAISEIIFSTGPPNPPPVSCALPAAPLPDYTAI